MDAAAPDLERLEVGEGMGRSASQPLEDLGRKTPLEVQVAVGQHAIG